ncbi:MAG TPA: lysophospholipid acyltransferase family protein [Roseiflexaceae bacterium]|nr:lysophospholipid acyltransferase family protein [Roseiflexaceae bacterium]
MNARSELPAIPARRNWAGDELIYRALVRWGVWSHFDRVWLKTVGPLPHPADGPLIAYLNHPSWWDGYMCMLLSRMVLRGRFQSFLMMEEPELRRYSFFRWAGCFSVDRKDARSSARSVAYIGGLLAEQRARSLYIFPQGVLTPNDRRPLVLYPGLAHVVRRAGGAMLWPVALRYEFRGEQRPEAFIRAGPPHHAPADADPRKLTAEIERRLTDVADALRDEVANSNLADYRTLLRGRSGVNRIFDAWRARLPFAKKR